MKFVGPPMFKDKKVVVLNEKMLKAFGILSLGKFEKPPAAEMARLHWRQPAFLLPAILNPENR